MSLEERIWRVIAPKLRDPVEIVAIDEVLHKMVASGKSQPTLLFNHWEPSISIGKPQAISDLNLEACKKSGIKIVRTSGGGRAVLHLGEKDVSYSLFSQTPTTNPTKIYEEFCGYIAEALKCLGLPVEIDNKNDFYIKGKKISGNALRIEEGALTQHGIILYDKHPADFLISLMNPQLYSESDITELNNRLISIKELVPEITISDLIGALTEKLTKGKYRKGDFTKEEKEEISKIKQLYQDPEWFKGNSVRGLCWLSKGEPRGSLRGA